MTKKDTVLPVVRVTAEQRELIEKAAELDGRKLSDYIRNVALKASKRIVAEEGSEK